MFNVDQAPTFTRPITFEEASGDGTVTQSFTATFRTMDVDAVQNYEFDKPADVKFFLEAVVIGLTDVTDKDDTPLQWSAELLGRVLSRLSARSALFKTYFSALQDAQMGNSNGLPAHGPEAALPQQQPKPESKAKRKKR